MKRVAEEDLQHIVTHCPSLESLRGARLFITGGTGFFGKWLLEGLTFANAALKLDLHVTALSRDPDSFLKSAPHLDNVTFLRGDVRTLQHDGQPYTHVIAGATAASQALNDNAPREMFDTIVEGTRRTLDFAQAAGAKRFLFLSSGAVYGAQTVTHVPETYVGAPDPLSVASAYGEGKRAAEWLCAQSGLPVTIARCFAFVGPHLPLDTHFAIGNFIRDALAGKDIIVKGDGTPRRSYLYASDLVIWLLHLLTSGANRTAYNVGSAEDLSIAELARVIAQRFGRQVQVLGTPDPNKPIARYVPDISRARDAMGLVPKVSLADAIEKTARFHTS